MGTEEFNTQVFEKKLNALKDSQDSINLCCQWCLVNRTHHKKIVATWLNVLKRVKIEQRLTLFYLANDVIQYSKRKNYDFVDSWGTALQKATTMVRDEKVKHKILRIFKIWEQRSVYSDEFLGDLSGLISASPVKKEESNDFQPNSLINRIRSCSKLEADTDLKLTQFKQHNPKLLKSEILITSLKDRAHVDDVEKEVEDYVQHMEHYVNALKTEIKARNNLINMLYNAETQMEADRKDVKIVAVAYKSFATRVKNLKKKLDEKKLTLNSPIPSPDINAPSPEPDSDIDLPDPEPEPVPAPEPEFTFTNAGFYTPVSTSAASENSNTYGNGFTSFLGSNMSFNIQNLNTSDLFRTDTTTASTTVEPTPQTADSGYSSNSIASLFPSIIQPPPPPAPVPPTTETTNVYPPYAPMPLAPPPLPPFSKQESLYDAPQDSYNDYSAPSTETYGNAYGRQPAADAYQPSYTSTTVHESAYDDAGSYQTNNGSFNAAAAVGADPGMQAYDPYNPEEEPETWEADDQWELPPSDIDTPASPPIYDKQSFTEPIEYHDRPVMSGNGSGYDVDHRVLNVLTNSNSDVVTEVPTNSVDVDHRNLISLTNSPREESQTSDNSVWSNKGDQDYRSFTKQDSDYRPTINVLESVTFPAPPPPPPPAKRGADNVESIDMDMSDEEAVLEDGRAVVAEAAGLLPPPPFPDDADANILLDSLNEELEEQKFIEDEHLQNSLYEDPVDEFQNEQWTDDQNQGNVSMQAGLLGEGQQQQQQQQHQQQPQFGNMGDNWSEHQQHYPPRFPPHSNNNGPHMPFPPFNRDMPFRGRGGGFGNRGDFRGRGDFGGRGDFRGRGGWPPFRGVNFRGVVNFRGGNGMIMRRPRIRGRGFFPRGRAGYNNESF